VITGVMLRHDLD